MLSNYLAYFSGSSKMFDKYQMPLVVREFTAITLPCKVNFLLLQILRIILSVLNFWYPKHLRCQTSNPVFNLFSLFHLISRGASSRT